MKKTDAATVFASSARDWPDRIAIECGDRKFTYLEMQSRIERLATSLSEFGLGPGDRVAVVLRNLPEYVETLLACARQGFICVPINRRLSAHEISVVLDHCEAKVVVTEPGIPHAMSTLKSRRRIGVLVGPVDTVTDGPYTYESLIAERDEGATPPAHNAGADPQAIYYTSGTTGQAKGVVRTYASNLAMATGVLRRIPFPLSEVDGCLYTIPLHSAGFWGGAFPTLMRGGRLVIMPDFDAQEALRQLGSGRITNLLMVPTMWEMILQVEGSADVDVSGVRFTFWGGAPMSETTVRRLDAWLPVHPLGAYGLTESTVCVISDDSIFESGRVNSAGLPVEGMELRIVDEDGSPVPAGEPGEVCLRGPIVMSHYWNSPRLTEQTIRDGWLHTGDWGYMDPDGALTVIDRKKDMLISGGENVYPAEVENVIANIPGVRQVAVVGLPDDVWGQRVCACLVADPAVVAAEDVEEACRAGGLARYKRPRTVVFLDELPMNSVGKIMKYKLVEHLASGSDSH